MDSHDRGRVTRGCVDRKFAEACKAKARQQRPTAKQRREAVEACMSYQAPQPWSAMWPVVIFSLLAVVIAAILLGGCVPIDAAVRHARVQREIETGHALDGNLPLEARQRAADSMRAWAAQEHLLAGEDPTLPETDPELAPEAR